MQIVSVEDFTKQSFDFIVVGGGTAGLAVAARLAEDGKFTVGVLEAGGEADSRDDVKIPGLMGMSMGSEIDWKFETVPQAELGGKKTRWSRGKNLGGTSALNFMTWTRGAREDYDAWEALGNSGWGWNDLLPFFKKSETFHPPSSAVQEEQDIRYDPEAFGTSGPIHLMYPNEYSPAHRLWLKALNSLGVRNTPAHVAGSNVGTWTNICSIEPRSMTRCFATSYCALAGSNLHILTQATVQEIVLDNASDGYVASGVRFTHNGQEHLVSASREVILSAGTIKSPHILELSGIGNPEILSRAGVAVKVDSPMVGENLQEHNAFHFVVEVDPELENRDQLILDPSYAAAAREKYSRDQAGPLGNLPCSVAFIPLAHFAPQETLERLYTQAQDITGLSPQKKSLMEQRLRDRDNLGQVEYIFKLGAAPYFEKGRSFGDLIQVLQYPFSAGSIHIQPTPAQDESPVIDPRHYHGVAGKLDLDVMLESTRFAHKVLHAPPLNDVVKELVNPPPSSFVDDERMKQQIAEGNVIAFHAIGTCAMGGHDGIRGGVVDERLRVYGVKGLRVADASVMPLHISAHIQATVYAIAEKAASMILEDVAEQS